MMSTTNYGLMELADSVGAAARRTLDYRAEKKRLDQINREYTAAMAHGARTGEDMPEGLAVEAGQYVTVDRMTRQTAVKVVALRELGKFNPAHPLVSRQVTRNRVADKALMKFNAGGRSMDHDPAVYAPTDDEAQEIFRATL